MTQHLTDIALLTLLVATALGVVRSGNPFAMVMLYAIYSFLSAGLFISLDAVDVAFTEAAVGAGIATLLMLGTLALVGPQPVARHRPRRLPLVVVLLTGGALIYGTLDMPPLGEAGAPVHEHVAPRYLEQSAEEVGIPNTVTAVLASYRSFDTLGEVTVIFTAGVGVLLLLGGRGGEDAP